MYYYILKKNEKHWRGFQVDVAEVSLREGKKTSYE